MVKYSVKSDFFKW